MIAAQVVVGGVTYGIFPALADELSEELPQESQEISTSAAGYEISFSPAPNLFRVWTPVDFPATGVRPQEIALTDKARTHSAATTAAMGRLRTSARWLRTARRLIKTCA
jgi:hypothetical protein